MKKRREEARSITHVARFQQNPNAPLDGDPVFAFVAFLAGMVGNFGEDFDLFLRDQLPKSSPHMRVIVDLLEMRLQLRLINIFFLSRLQQPANVKSKIFNSKLYNIARNTPFPSLS